MTSSTKTYYRMLPKNFVTSEMTVVGIQKNKYVLASSCQACSFEVLFYRFSGLWSVGASNFYDVIIIDDVIVNMIWNPLTKSINLRYQSTKSVNNYIFSDFFLILMTSHDVINDVFYKPMDFSQICLYTLSMTLFQPSILDQRIVG